MSQNRKRFWDFCQRGMREDVKHCLRGGKLYDNCGASVMEGCSRCKRSNEGLKKDTSFKVATSRSAPRARGWRRRKSAPVRVESSFFLMCNHRICQCRCQLLKFLRELCSVLVEL